MDITRRETLKAGAAWAARPGLAAPRRPNLLLLMVDQYRADCLGLDGNRMPLGMQLAAVDGDDDRLLGVARWCEARLPFQGLV